MKRGDLVCLKSGGPIMVVDYATPTQDEMVALATKTEIPLDNVLSLYDRPTRVYWMSDSGLLQEGLFHPDLLAPYKADY